MKTLIFLLVLNSLQVYALDESKIPDTSPAENCQEISEDVDSLYLRTSDKDIHVCKNLTEKFVNCMFSSPHVRRSMEQELCKETQNNLNVALRTENDKLNEKLALMKQREIETKNKLEIMTMRGNEAQSRLKIMQEKEGELNSTLAACHREISDTKNRQQTLENLILSSESRLKETVKFHSDLNSKLVENVALSNTSNLAMQMNNMDSKMKILLQLQLSGAVMLSTGTYVFVNIRKSWPEARKYCQDMGIDLVAVETAAEDQALVLHARSMGGRISSYAYTSGCYSAASNSFVWRSTGQNVSYTNWESGYPSATFESECIQIYVSSNVWRHFTDTEPFICEVN